MPWEKTFDEETGNSRIFAFGAVSVLSAGVLTAEQKFFGSAEAIPSWEFFGKIFCIFGVPFCLTACTFLRPG